MPRWCLLLALVPLAGCTVWNRIEACQGAQPAPIPVNHRFDGTQNVGSPWAAAPLPSGNALVAFASEVAGRSLTDASEIRSVRVTAGGGSLPSCERNDNLDD